jgi:hypothetical protein
MIYSNAHLDAPIKAKHQHQDDHNDPENSTKRRLIAKKDVNKALCVWN